MCDINFNWCLPSRDNNGCTANVFARPSEPVCVCVLESVPESWQTRSTTTIPSVTNERLLSGTAAVSGCKRWFRCLCGLSVTVWLHDVLCFIVCSNRSLRLPMNSFIYHSKSFHILLREMLASNQLFLQFLLLCLLPPLLPRATKVIVWLYRWYR